MIAPKRRRLIVRGASVAAIFVLPSTAPLAKVFGTPANPFEEVLVVTFRVSMGFWLSVLYAILWSILRFQKTCPERTRIACELAIFTAFVIGALYVGAFSRRTELDTQHAKRSLQLPCSIHEMTLGCR